MPIYQGTIRRASGHLGAFRIVADRLAAATPSSRGALAFAGAPRITCASGRSAATTNDG